MVDISYNKLVLDRQRDLDRLSQSKIMEDRSRAKWRHKEQDVAGVDLVKSAVHQMKTEAQMKDSHRLARVAHLNVKGKRKHHYSTDDLSRSNYQGQYEM